jgi:hypothetical protein
MATVDSGLLFAPMVYFYSTGRSTSNTLKYGVYLRFTGMIGEVAKAAKILVSWIFYRG